MNQTPHFLPSVRVGQVARQGGLTGACLRVLVWLPLALLITYIAYSV